MTSVFETIGQWSFRFFPAVALYKKGQHDPLAILVAFLAIALISCAATFVLGLISREKLVRYSHIFFIGPVLAFFFLAVEIASQAGTLPFTPIHILFGLILFFIGIYVTGVNHWIVLRMTGGLPARLPQQMMSFLWMNLIVSSYLFIPIFLSRLPVFNKDESTFFLGNLIAMIAAYVFYDRFFLPNALTILGLKLPKSALTRTQREILDKIIEKHEERGYEFILGKRGIINAFAVSSKKKFIILGVDLLDHLEVNELKAVLLHEEGHLQDHVNIPKRKLYRTLISAFIFLFMIQSQAGLIGSGLFEFFLWLVGYLFLASRMKKARLRAEIVADSYVRSQGEGMYRDLLEGLRKMSVLNSTDKDLCKRLNADHLDLDEREKHVTAEVESLPKRSLTRNVLATIFIIFLSIFLIIKIQNFILTPTAKWENAQARYDTLMDDEQYAEAEEKGWEAVRIAEEQFGKISHQSYTSMNDLTDVLIYEDKYSEALSAGMDAVRIGGELYGETSLELVRSLQNAGQVHYYEKEYAAAEMWFTRALELQRKLDDAVSGITFTLFWQSHVLERSGKTENAVVVLEELMELYARDPDNEWDLVRTMVRTAALRGESNREKADDLHSEALLRTKSAFGDRSSEYAEILFKVGFSLYKRGDHNLPEPYFTRGLEILDSHSEPDHYLIEDMLYRMAWVYYQGGDETKHTMVLKAILQRNREWKGQLDQDDIDSLWPLARSYESSGELQKAVEQYYQVAAIEESIQDLDPEDLIETYTAIIRVLDRMGERSKADEFRAKLKGIRGRN